MKNRKLVPCLFMALIFIAAAVFVVSAQEVADEFVIKSPLFKEYTKPGVKLTHKDHNEKHGVACQECHHVYENGQNTWKEGDPVKKCHECHTNDVIKGEKKLSPEDQKLNLKIAFHDNCQSCHKEQKKKNKDTTAPTTCKQCHSAEE